MSEIGVVSWSFNDDPSALQNALIFEASISGFFNGLLNGPHFVQLKTCNRLEYYFIENSQPPFDNIPPGYRHLQGKEAIKHLILVASGLDSLSVGESEILSQVKSAFTKASESGSLDKMLQQIFRMAIFAGKKVRTDTGISKGKTSIAHISIDLLKEKHSLEGKRILLIGTGKIATKILKYLTSDKRLTISLMGRNEETGAALASENGCRYLDISDLREAILENDVIITATTSSRPIIEESDIISISGSRELILLDVSNPCNIETKVADLNNIYLYTFSDLEAIIRTNIEIKKEEIIKARQIVEEQLKVIMEKMRELEMDHLVESYMKYSERLAAREAQKALSAIREGGDPSEVLSAMSGSISRKILRPYILAVKEAARSPENENADSLKSVLSKIRDTS
ncbi:MAG: glutamyl-tRNA reductase [Thermoplasmataceae archaeon]|jgi:glutamyl-tRNA reductase